jgi:hypothetical protein
MILGAHFHNYCTQITSHNVDSLSPLIFRNSIPALNRVWLYRRTPNYELSRNEQFVFIWGGEHRYGLLEGKIKWKMNENIYEHCTD